MPGSLPWLKREIAAHVRAELAKSGPPVGGVVDVGPGAGWWADLVGHGRMDAVEVHGPYVERYGLASRYNTVIVNDVRAIYPAAYGWRYAIMGDVLEHLPVQDAAAVVRRWTAAGVRLLVALPFLSPQEATGDNAHEAHVQDDLTPAIVAERFPDLRPLALRDDYGYFANYDADPVVSDGLPDPEPPQRVHVLWWEGARGYWDHGLVSAFIDGSLWPTVRPYSFVQHERAVEIGNTGALVVVSGRWAARSVDEFREWEGRRAWTLAVITSDEESDLRAERVAVPTSLVIMQTPAPDTGPGVWHRMVLGPRIDLARTVLSTPELAAMPPGSRSHLWCFSGQVRDNVARQECVRVLGREHAAHPRDEALLHVTGGFGQGAPFPEYLAQLRASEIAISPSGPATPDCFRTWEALEMGALPIAQRHSPRQRYWPDYYAHALNVNAEEVPFPRVESWDELPAILARYRAKPLDLVRDQNRASAWWQRRKRALAYDLEDSVRAVSGMVAPESARGLRSRLTIIVTASPIASHPDTAVIDECIARLRSYPELAECEVLLCMDGIRPEQEHRRADYLEWSRRVIWRCNWDTRWRGVVPMVFDEHRHQSGMLSPALAEVRTPLVMYVEADTWPVGDLPWSRIAAAVESGAGGLRMLRLHYDVQIHPEHEYLMLEPAPVDCGGVPVRRTRQWSQRPHIARTDYYRDRVSTVFGADDRTFIEDIIYGRAEGGTWGEWGLGIYAPPGDMRRSTTCDGRGSEPKYDIVHGGRRMKA